MSFSITFCLGEVGSQQASEPPVSATTVLLLLVDKIMCSLLCGCWDPNSVLMAKK